MKIFLVATLFVAGSVIIVLKIYPNSRFACSEIGYVVAMMKTINSIEVIAGSGSDLVIEWEHGAEEDQHVIWAGEKQINDIPAKYGMNFFKVYVDGHLVLVKEHFKSNWWKSSHYQIRQKGDHVSFEIVECDSL